MPNMVATETTTGTDGKNTLWSAGSKANLSKYHGR